MFAAVTVLLVALGTGAVTTIFSATNAMLLRPLPGASNTAQLYSIDRKHRNGTDGMTASYSYYTQLRDQTRSFDGIAAWNNTPNIYGFGSPCALSDSLWNNHQRVHQYVGGHNEAYGGITINIDTNALDGPGFPP